MSDLQRMIASLERIVAHLRRLRRPVPDLLLPPLSADEIASWASQLPFSFTREIEAIYQWHNGTKAEEGDLLTDLYFLPGFYFVSMQEAVEIYRERDGSEQWRKGWFPLFADGAGDFYIVACKPEKLDDSRIIGFLHGEPEQPAEYESLSTMIQTVDAAYAERAFFVDEDNTLEIDDDRYAIIANRFNPSIPEWQS